MCYIRYNNCAESCKMVTDAFRVGRSEKCTTIKIIRIYSVKSVFLNSYPNLVYLHFYLNSGNISKCIIFLNQVLTA